MLVSISSSTRFFTNIDEYNEFNKIKDSKIDYVYTNSFWNYYMDNKYLKLFKKPKITIISNNKFGICCNLIHIFIFLNKLIHIKNTNLCHYNIIDAKRKNFNELIFKLESDYLNIEQYQDNLTRKLKINIIEHDIKLEIELIENNYLFKFYRNNILLDSFQKKIGNVSTHLVYDYNNMIIENNQDVKLCSNDISYLCHKKLFSVFKDIKNLKIT